MFGKVFAHRPKSNGTYDSICTKCCTTAAFGMTEEQLDLEEQKHICDKEVLHRIAENVAA